MVYSSYHYTPKYYSTLQDSITTLCKSILPFSFKKRSLPPTEHNLSKLQSDNLKWQQNSFHQVLNLMALHSEGILAQSEVTAFRTNLLDTLIASPPQQEHPLILRDKLLFLQELLYAKCISEEEYHSSKRPLLQRLAVQGAHIEATDVIAARPKEKEDPKETTSEEEWSVIDLRDDKDKDSSVSSKNKSARKHIKGAASVFGFGSSHKHGKNGMEKSVFELPSHPSKGSSILMEESGPPEKLKRKPFVTLFQREPKEEHGGGEAHQIAGKSVKKQWGFEGFKKWKRSELDDENEREACQHLGEGPDTKLIKKKLHADGSPSDFFIDKVLGDKIKKELSRIQTELSTTNPNLRFTNDQIEAISTKIPVDKAELKNYFPKSWCDRYGDVVLDVVKKEFKEHVGEMENMRNIAREKHSSNSNRWTTFGNDENMHPNSVRSSYINPFSQGYSQTKWN
ncbi:hypothetical protein HN51_002339 [Arachis hypogaea]|uniref:Uncharacterized protein n=1 Tax=Arachis hypogaea TaxID=3818 RepID=A0A445EN08_ARAHY|nr:uncharacterized protein LOC112701192 [Arachis hypogaea]RYR76756.1 hypothetical protein Ahy_A01g001311 [Arachis hypogaea]